jgi:SAM-dependent methyltransferase
MIEMCPLCGKSLDKLLVNDFRYCSYCDLATREEASMPSKPDLIYTDEWVKAEETEMTHPARVKFTIAQVKKLTGVNCILDVGCGGGKLVDGLNLEGYEADGADSSTVVLEYARSTKRGRFFLTSAELLEGVPSEKEYDLIIANHLIEHLRDPKIFLENIRKHLKNGGYMYIETPNLESWDPKSLWRGRAGGLYGSDHRICYTLNSLSRLMENNGFVIHKAFTRTYSLTIFNGIVGYALTSCKGDIDVRAGKGLQKSSKVSWKILKCIYRGVRNSPLLAAMLYVPNRFSEFKDRGNHMIIIAEKQIVNRIDELNDRTGR